MLSFKLLYVITLSAVVISCSSEIDLQHYNTYGGSSRTNNYEHLGTFYDYKYTVEKINLPDSSGVSVLPLVIDALYYYLSTVEGTVALIEEKNAKWYHSLGKGQIVATGMAADKDKNLYLITNLGEVQSYSFEGELRWKYKHPHASDSNFIYENLLATRDGIIVTASSGIIYKLSNKGQMLWEYKHTLQYSGYPASDEFDNSYFALTHNDYYESDTILSIDSQGRVRWQTAFEKTRILKNPICQSGLIVYPASLMLNGNRLYLIIALDTNGKEQWRKEINIMPTYISADSQGNFYVVSQSIGMGETMSGIFCYNNKGDLVWKLYTGNKITSPILISKRNLAFFGGKSNSYGVFFLNREGVLVSSLSLADAPVFMHKPFVLHEPVIAFMGLQKLFVLKIDETAINKILPW